MVLGGFCFMQKHCQKGQWCLWSMICLVGMERLLTHLARKVFMKDGGMCWLVVKISVELSNLFFPWMCVHC